MSIIPRDSSLFLVIHGSWWLNPTCGMLVPPFGFSLARSMGRWHSSRHLRCFRSPRSSKDTWNRQHWPDEVNPWRIHGAAIYGVPWIPSTKNPVMLALIYKKTMDPSWVMGNAFWFCGEISWKYRDIVWILWIHIHGFLTRSSIGPIGYSRIFLF